MAWLNPPACCTVPAVLNLSGQPFRSTGSNVPKWTPMDPPTDPPQDACAPCLRGWIAHVEVLPVLRLTAGGWDDKTVPHLYMHTHTLTSTYATTPPPTLHTLPVHTHIHLHAPGFSAPNSETKHAITGVPQIGTRLQRSATHAPKLTPCTIHTRTHTHAPTHTQTAGRCRTSPRCHFSLEAKLSPLRWAYCVGG
jgi:hypothetical protein